MRSLATAALCISLIHTSGARVPHSFRDLIQRDAQPEPQHKNGLFGWLSRLLKRDLMPRQEATCYEDDYYTFVGSPQLGEGFCQDYLGYPDRTIPVQATATSTLTTIYTTYVDTTTEYALITPGTTVTATVTAGGAKVKREGEAQITARAALGRSEAFRFFRRQSNNTDNDDVMASAFTSACSCHDYDPPIVSETYTGQTTVRTIRAFQNSDTTVTETQLAGPSATTTTVTVAAPPTTTPANSPSQGGSSPEDPSEDGSPPTVSPTGGSATTPANPSNPTPTAPAFTCPDDNNTTVSQMVSSERFDYLVLCDMVLMDVDIYNGALSYGSFSECVGACSIANQQFDNPVCQGVSFYATDSSGSGNCFLKGDANNTVMADGVDSALLQQIAVGVSNDTVEGTATESLPFAGVQPTASPSQFNSVMSSMLANSTNAMPLVTPWNPAVPSGRQVAAITAYSTYISDGSTFSTGTGFTTATTFANGSWVSAYYTSYSLSWASATTIYGASETGIAVTNSTKSDVQTTNSANGEQIQITTTNYTTYFPEGYNVTQVIGQETFDRDGVPISSTATTNFYSYQTAGAGGGAGGSGAGSPASTPAGPLVTPTGISNSGSSTGGDAGSAAGGPASGGPSPITSTSIFTTLTVISQPGGTGGAASGYVSGGTPVTQTFVSTFITNGSTAYSTFYVISGRPQETGAVISGDGSGTLGTAPLTPITVISTVGATGGESGGVASGGPGNTGGASSSILSGGSPSSTPSIPASLSIFTIISNSGAANGASSGFGVGGPGATEGGTSLFLSGGPSPSSTPSASLTGDNRSGQYSTAPGTAPSSDATSPYGTSPTASFTGDNRSGTYGTSPSTVPGTSRSGATSINVTAPPGTSSLSASFTGDNRSGTTSTSSSSPPIFTAPSGGIYSSPGIAPSGSSPGTYSGTGLPRSGEYRPGLAPSATVPESASPRTDLPGTFSNTRVPWLGQLSTPSVPSGTAPGTAPIGSSPGTYSGTGLPRSGEYDTSPAQFGYLPFATGPLPSPPSPYPAPSGGAPSGSASVPAPSGSSPVTYSGTGLPRSGTYETSPAGTAPGTAPLSGYPAPTGTSPGAGMGSSTIALSTDAFPSMTLPTAQTTCANMTMGTTTILSTTTVYGCYSTCLPSWGGWGGYGAGPQPFGPPAGATDGPPAPEESD